ncbi:MAG: TolC family protein [Burkholderiaceae bacterium]
MLREHRLSTLSVPFRARLSGASQTLALCLILFGLPAIVQAQVTTDTTRLAQRPAAAAIPLAEMVNYAIVNYPAIAIARSARNVAKFGIQQARSKHYPTVSVSGARRLDGDVTGSLGPRLNLNLYASGAINAEIDREKWREKSLASTEIERREDVAFEVVQAYFRLVGAIRLRDTTQRSLDRHLDLVADFQEIARLDRGRRFDLIQAQARAEQVRFQLAERKTEIALAIEGLARYYPLPFDAENLPAPTRLDDPNPINTARQLSLANQHPTVLAAERQLFAARANLRVARGNRGPRVDVESQTGGNRFSQLTLSWPAFDLAASAAQDSADAALIGAQAEVDEQRSIILETQRVARASWRTANEREAIATNQIGIAESLVEVYREQFGIGRRNLLDLLNAYSELANAEAAAVISQTDAGLARHQIEYAAGRLTLAFVSKVP